MPEVPCQPKAPPCGLFQRLARIVQGQHKRKDGMSAEILDWKEALGRVMQKRDLYCKLLRKFMEMEKDSAARISVALRNGDTDTARQAAHTVKGTAANLGAKALAAAALELEMALRGGADTALPMKHYEDALTDTLVAMGAFLAG